MQTILFHDIIFGPIKSRRLGISLGINLLPTDGKICSFDCIYCECGYNAQGKGSGINKREDIKAALEHKLQEMKEKGEVPDVLTFAGNGEPTLHPDFEAIIDDTIELRNRYFPNAKVSVLSNATCISKETVFNALNRVDNNILKLDSAYTETIRLINSPNVRNYTAEQLIENLQRFNGNLIIQTMFLRGQHNGQIVDNTTEQEISAWLEAIKQIRPKQVMIYTIDRQTPEKRLEKIPVHEMNAIADRVRTLGFDVSVSA